MLGQQRLNLDVTRDQARATVVQSWGQLDAAKAQIEATTAQVNAAEIALNGVREEARVGQRTTLDVLNAQQELVNARVALVTAQHDRVVASYTLLAAVGGLSMQRLGLNVTIYDPQVHYQQVRDAWIGVRSPDGSNARFGLNRLGQTAATRRHPPVLFAHRVHPDRRMCYSTFGAADRVSSIIRRQSGWLEEEIDFATTPV